MRRILGLMGFALLALGISACGDDGSGGAVDSDAALHGFMQTIALDFAQVLAEVAPSNESLALKADGSANCPQGGSAAWTETGLGGGTLTLSACRMRGIDVTGTLLGYLELGPSSVSAVMLQGPVAASGLYSGDLNVTSMALNAELPVADESTYWEVYARNPDGKMLCAWSGGSGCAPVF